MPGKRKNHIGRLRIRAAEILNRNFPELDVAAEDILPVTGSWRSCPYHDVYRWQLFTRRRDGRACAMWGCWSTLTEFVRLASKYGCAQKDDVIYENESPPPAQIASPLARI